VIDESVATTFTRIAAGQSLRKTSSGPAPRDGRLAAHRVARDVELVRLMGDELHAREERGVVERRGDLADASADGVLEPPVEDLRRGDEPALDGPLAERVVEREDSPGSTIVPSSICAARWMFVTRGWQQE
jgi:hypothetical protein